MEMLVGSSFILEICSGTGYIFEVYTICLYYSGFRIMKSLKLYFSHIRLYMPPAQQEKNKQNSKDEAVMVEEEEIQKDNNEEPKEKNSLIKEGNKDELREETHIVQDIDQGNEDIEEADLED
jgi:hypothetical protein